MTSHCKFGEPSSASQMLCSNMAQGIHAMAQPLAVLMASLSKDHTDLMSLDELRELAASSAAEVQRACTLLGYLQQLVVADSIKPRLCATPFLPVLAHVVEGVELL